MGGSSARRLTARIETWPVAGSFVIARGAKTVVDVVVVQVVGGGHIGRGEGTAIYYHGETAASVLAQAEAMADAVAAGCSRADLLSLMPRGAARNAVDSALWDLEAKQGGTTAWQLAGVPPLAPLQSAFTISLGDAHRMQADASAAASVYPLLKLKLAGEGDVERVAAVRRGAPRARLIVDANESWTGRDVAAEAARLAIYGVELVEQPVKAGQDYLLDGVVSPIPFCADESCQDRSDLERCAGRYAAINIKLDKAGGLTEALALAADARVMGLELMVGCMLSTSLGIAPAMMIGQGARWVDIDGPLLLARDREPCIHFERGVAQPPSAALWG